MDEVHGGMYGVEPIPQPAPHMVIDPFDIHQARIMDEDEEPLFGLREALGDADQHQRARQGWQHQQDEDEDFIGEMWRW